MLLSESVKVGRSVAQSRPAQTNAIFDCKVLSRHHALLWYENGKVCAVYVMVTLLFYHFIITISYYF